MAAKGYNTQLQEVLSVQHQQISSSESSNQPKNNQNILYPLMVLIKPDRLLGEKKSNKGVNTLNGSDT